MTGIFNAFQDKRLLISTDLFSFSVDVTRSIQHNITNQTTSHAIEDGSDITDHIIKRPDTLSISGVISDSPLGIFALGNPLITSALNDGKISKQVLDDYIIKARDDQLLFSITTGLRSYENLVMTSFSVTETSQTANSLDFQASFTQISFVTSEDVEINTAADTVAPVKKNTGTKETIEATAEQGQGSSILYDQFVGN